MKKIVYLLLVVVVMVNSRVNAQTNSAFTLQQCVETAIKNNLQVQQNGLQVQTAEINWKQAKLNLLPDLNGSASTGINFGRSIDPSSNNYVNQQINFASYGLSSGVVLFNGLTLRNTVKQTALAYQASKMDWQQAKDNITIDIILAYLQVLTNEDLLSLSQSQAALSKKQVDRLVVLNNDGAIAPSQLSDLKGQYANDQLNIVDRQAALESAKLSLCELMNIPYDKNIRLERLTTGSIAEKYTATPDSIYQTALQQFSLVKSAELRQQSAAKSVKVAKGQLFPTLTLNGNANTNYSSAASNDIFINNTFITSDDYVLVNGNPSPVVYKQSNFSSQKIGYGKQLNNNLFTSVSLNLRIPIFNALQNRNRIKLAEINLKNAASVASTTKTQLELSIEQAYINMNASADRYKILLEQVNAFTISFHAAEVRFDAGVGNSIDYLIAKNNLDRANTSLVSVKYDYVLRTKVLDYYQGRQLW